MKSLTLPALALIVVIVSAGCNRNEERSVAPISLKDINEPPVIGKLGNEERSVAPISLEDINEHPVIGKLGIPLGELATIRGTVIDGDSTKMKEYKGEFLLRITSVNGKELKSEPLMPFANANGTEVEGIDSIWVGKPISLEVYETGEFSGMPDDLPDHWPIWAAPSYAFRTHLNILSWPDE